jgi:hypothetical protein
LKHDIASLVPFSDMGYYGLGNFIAPISFDLLNLFHLTQG